MARETWSEYLRMKARAADRVTGSVECHASNLRSAADEIDRLRSERDRRGWPTRRQVEDLVSAIGVAEVSGWTQRTELQNAHAVAKWLQKKAESWPEGRMGSTIERTPAAGFRDAAEGTFGEPEVYEPGLTRRTALLERHFASLESEVSRRCTALEEQVNAFEDRYATRNRAYDEKITALEEQVATLTERIPEKAEQRINALEGWQMHLNQVFRDLPAD